MFDRVLGIIQQEYYITKRSLEVIIDLFFFSAITIVVFGFVAKYLAGTQNPTAAYYLLIGLVLWEVIRIGQYSVTVAILWNVWSRNLSNMFVSPLSGWEYIVALMLSALIKSLIVLFMLAAITGFFFNFNIFVVGIHNLILFFINLIMFAWAIGIIIIGLIFRYGTRIQALSWGLIFLFQPLSASFFPLSILPEPIQKVAYFVPATHVFESARNSISNQTVDWGSFFIALGLNIIYLTSAFVFFYFMFKKSRKTGQFARNEG